MNAALPKIEERKAAAGDEGNVFSRWNSLLKYYGNTVAPASLFGAFSRAIDAFANQPQIQSSRVKAISTLPATYSKEELGQFLTAPSESEKPLREISQVLRYSNYSVFKITKSYADMLTYKHYCQPLYVDGEAVKDERFKREMLLNDRIDKAFRPEELGHKACMQCGTQGKVFYTLRSNIDKVHNKVNYLFAQQLPTEWCYIIGYNNISGYTISFDMFYFLQPGTDYTQYGDLFEPYIKDFSRVIETIPTGKPDPKFVYAKENGYTVKAERFNAQGAGNPTMFQQNGRWIYYVSLPIDRVWTFEIDDGSPIRVPFVSGLLQSFNQQADYEAAQYSLTLQPLLMLVTGELPYYDSDHATTDDQVRLSPSGRQFFEMQYYDIMRRTNTGGSAIYSAPFENIKSHTFPVDSDANSVSSSYLQYGMEKTGLTGLIPVAEDPKQGVSEYSAKLESRFAERIYRTLEKMMNYFTRSLNLKYEWEWHFFGTVYRDDQTRTDLQKALDKGDITAYLKLAALDDMTLLDKLSVSHAIKGSGWLNMLEIPPTAYTQSAKNEKKTDNPQGGAPQKTEVEVQETKREKQIEVKDAV